MAYTNIDDPSAYFQTKTYTGNSGVQFVTNDGNSDLQPDWVWIKNRTVGYSHQLYDSSRGTTKALFSDLTQAETTISNGLLTFNTNGFGVNSAAAVNENELVAWQWKANGGTTSSNTDGNITSTVQSNQDAGFSIVTWTGNENSSATVGHGLGVKPDMVIFKRRNATYNWVVYCGQLGLVGGNNMFAYLNLTNAAEQGAGFNFTSTTITPTNGAPTNSGDMIAYCFASKQGYSKFGKYVGNGNADGPFVYTGFKPAFLMIKVTNTVGNWFMTDHKRNPFNLTDDWLVANGSGAETNVLNASSVDYLSNGFKLRNSYSETNNSGWSFIYMAFAENPFTTSTGIPTTAR